jgi:hypothetical protein
VNRTGYAYATIHTIGRKLNFSKGIPELKLDEVLRVRKPSGAFVGGSKCAEDAKALNRQHTRELIDRLLAGS